MITIQKITLAAIVAIAFTACKKDVDPIIIVQPSTGTQVELNGIAAGEAGSAAANAVYLDLSAEKQIASLPLQPDSAEQCHPPRTGPPALHSKNKHP